MGVAAGFRTRFTVEMPSGGWIYAEHDGLLVCERWALLAEEGRFWCMGLSLRGVDVAGSENAFAQLELNGVRASDYDGEIIGEKLW